MVTAGGVTCSGSGAEVGLGSLALIKAHPPSVAASEAAVINSFTPGALVLAFLTGLVMIVAMFVFMLAILFAVIIAVIVIII